jgi:serine phosphatase RsbU (regulator of sigma subunit)
MLPDSFVLFMPRNIVSGDFYWCVKTEQGLLLAVADCTGHGVPGAFMSMIGHTLLNEIVNVKGIVAPAAILEELDKGIKQALKKDSASENFDGMDIALLRLEGNRLQYAGAVRNLVLVRDGVLTEIKGDKRSIGSYVLNDPFTGHEMLLEKGDCVYLSSDGYADQFGGDRGKKLMRKNFNELLAKISVHPMSEQGRKLGELMNEWRGNYEQVDDICVVGFRVQAGR